MAYVLTTSGNSNGWGCPKVIFNNKKSIEKWAIEDMKKNHGPITIAHNVEISINTKNSEPNFYIKSSCERKEDDGTFLSCVEYYEVFILDIYD